MALLVLDWVFLVTDQVPPFLEWQSTLISDMEGTKSSHHDRMSQPLYLTCSSEWLWDSSLSLGGSLNLENTKSLSKVLEVQPSQWLRQYISYLFLRRNIQELHCSSLHHIPDIVILDLDMLWLVMEYRVLQQLHITLVVTIYTSSIQLEIKQIR